MLLAITVLLESKFNKKSGKYSSVCLSAIKAFTEEIISASSISLESNLISVLSEEISEIKYCVEKEDDNLFE